MDTEQAQALRKPFPKEAVGKIPKGGVMLDYVGHANITDRLLSVDPEWTWEPAGYTDHGLPMFDGGNGLWIRLTVCGVTRYGYGDGPDPKQCISDAIRNAAMRFGAGLDLWSKEELESSGADARVNAGASTAPSPDPTSAVSEERRDSSPPGDEAGGEGGSGEAAPLPLQHLWQEVYDMTDGVKSAARRAVTKANKRTKPATAHNDAEITEEELLATIAYLKGSS